MVVVPPARPAPAVAAVTANTETEVTRAVRRASLAKRIVVLPPEDAGERRFRRRDGVLQPAGTSQATTPIRTSAGRSSSSGAAKLALSTSVAAPTAQRASSQGSISIGIPASGEKRVAWKLSAKLLAR